jgi:hypothetical protein
MNGTILLDKTHYESLGSFEFSEDTLVKIAMRAQTLHTGYRRV